MNSPLGGSWPSLRSFTHVRKLLSDDPLSVDTTNHLLPNEETTSPRRRSTSVIEGAYSAELGQPALLQDVVGGNFLARRNVVLVAGNWTARPIRAGARGRFVICTGPER